MFFGPAFAYSAFIYSRVLLTSRNADRPYDRLYSRLYDAGKAGSEPGANTK
jgi:hypothetical protein